MRRLLCVTLLLLALGTAQAAVYNVKVVSDSRPDFSDMPSLIRSATGSYQTTDEKCKAMWRWLTRSRRQTPEAFLHGSQVHDPILFYNDFGYSMCSDYAALNAGIWTAMGLPARTWDITQHTVSECFYDGRWHLFDNSMSAYYTLCDGKTVAGVEDIGKPGACEASGGKTEVAHIAKYHCAAATSPNGFLSGCDTQRTLKEEGEYVFNTNRLQLERNHAGFELGHRYVLNLREGESYTRYAQPQGTTTEYYLPQPDGSNPQQFGTLGNGEWTWTPDLTKERTRDDLWRNWNVRFTAKGLQAKNPRDEAMATFRISGANIITDLEVTVDYELPTKDDHIGLVVDNPDDGGQEGTVLDAEGPRDLGRRKVVKHYAAAAGAHAARVGLWLYGRPIVHSVTFRTTTQLNKLTLPSLTLGRNTIDVVADSQTDTVQLWPELQKNRFTRTAFGHRNVTSGEASDYRGCLWPEKPGEGAVNYAVETPGPMTELTYGGRFYNRTPGSSIALEHSFDGGKTWRKQWTLTDTQPPWDTVHFETVKVPAGVTRALVRYTLRSSVGGSSEGCSIYAIRAEAEYRPRNAQFAPFTVTYSWDERQEGKWVERTHAQRVTQPRQRYTVEVGGEDVPRLNWIRVQGLGVRGQETATANNSSPPPSAPPLQVDLERGTGGEDRNGGGLPKAKAPVGPVRRVRHVWGSDLALGKHYTFSVPSGDNWDGGDAEMTKLTDAVVASTYGGGSTYRWGPIWAPGKNPGITLDLEKPEIIAAVRMHVTGYPYDFYNGPFCTVEVLTSMDGKQFQSQGSFPTRMRAVDLDGDFLNQERGGFESLVFPFFLKTPVTARYVRWEVTNPEVFFDTSEVMVYGAVREGEWREPVVMPLG